MKLVPVLIRYKVKLWLLDDGTKDGQKCFTPKRHLTRHDCNLKPCSHNYYNSDLFLSMLNNAHLKAIGSHNFLRLNELPLGVTIQEGSFLSEVTVSTLV